eukprot:UN10964
MSKYMQIIGYIFIVATIFAFVVNALTHYKPIEICTETVNESTLIFRIFYQFAFAAQLYLLLFVFYFRVKTVFQKSPFKLSHIVNNIYVGMFITIAIYTFVTLYVSYEYSVEIFLPLHIGFLLLFMGLMISILVLFIIIFFLTEPTQI